MQTGHRQSVEKYYKGETRKTKLCIKCATLAHIYDVENTKQWACRHDVIGSARSDNNNIPAWNIYIILYLLHHIYTL